MINTLLRHEVMIPSPKVGVVLWGCPKLPGMNRIYFY